MESGTVIAILPCNDVDASERFYNRREMTKRHALGCQEEDERGLL